MTMHSALQTDLYQLTMGAAYWHSGKAEQEAVFHLFFRRLPFHGGYAIAAGLEQALAWVADFRFTDQDIEWLGALKTANETPLFDKGYLEYLRNLKLSLDIDAMPEGTAAFSHQPLLRVQGPILHAQLVETALLNIMNFQTLVATKAARTCIAAAGAPVVEFGLRRAQGPDGGLSASRAAWLGGCAGTSNVLAGQLYDIPVRGTHAHSWVMSFDHEAEAFDRYVEVMPDNSTLLVDTYDTLKGVDHAIDTARKLRERGHELSGIRLDSGDLAWLSQQARQKLDEAGFPNTKVVATNDLDEHIIESLRNQGARIDIWGVGTNLVTCADQPALGGVYKLSAIRDENGEWQPRVKRSEQTVKSSIPGRLQVRRFTSPEGFFIADAIYDEDHAPEDKVEIVDPADPIRHKKIPANAKGEDLLVPVMRKGERLPIPTLAEARERRAAQLGALHPTIKRLQNPHSYPAGIELGLTKRREELLQTAF